MKSSKGLVGVYSLCFRKSAGIMLGGILRVNENNLFSVLVDKTSSSV